MSVLAQRNDTKILNKSKYYDEKLPNKRNDVLKCLFLEVSHEGTEFMIAQNQHENHLIPEFFHIHL